jgi:hypothetical protein
MPSAVRLGAPHQRKDAAVPRQDMAVICRMARWLTGWRYERSKEAVSAEWLCRESEATNPDPWSCFTSIGDNSQRAVRLPSGTKRRARRMAFAVASQPAHSALVDEDIQSPAPKPLYMSKVLSQAGSMFCMSEILMRARYLPPIEYARPSKGEKRGIRPEMSWPTGFGLSGVGLERLSDAVPVGASGLVQWALGAVARGEDEACKFSVVVAVHKCAPYTVYVQTKVAVGHAGEISKLNK